MLPSPNKGDFSSLKETCLKPDLSPLSSTAWGFPQLTPLSPTKHLQGSQFTCSSPNIASFHQLHHRSLPPKAQHLCPQIGTGNDGVISPSAAPTSTLRNLRDPFTLLTHCVAMPLLPANVVTQDSPFLINTEISSAKLIPKTNAGAVPLANGGSSQSFLRIPFPLPIHPDGLL